MELNHLEHWDLERDPLLGAANAGRTDPDRPEIGNLIEVPG
jgi:hypothetical protein